MKSAPKLRLLSLTLIFSILLAGVALADTIHLDGSTVTRTGGTNYLDVTTGTGTVQVGVGYQLQNQGPECDVSATTPGTLALADLPTGVTIVSGATFTSCSNSVFQTVTLGVGPSVVAGNYNITPSMTREGGGGEFNVHSNAPFTLRIYDGTPPIITESVAPSTPNGDNGWYKSGDIVVTFTVTDPNSPVISMSAPCDATTTFNTDSATHSVTCQATSSGGTGGNTVNVKRDVTAPLVAITSHADGASVSTTSITLAGTASDATSGLVGGNIKVNGSDVAVSSGAWSTSVNLDCGSNQITAAAKDNAGNTASAVINVTRTCASATYSGTFLRPVDGGGVINIVKQGRSVPVKLEVFLGSDELKTGAVTFHQRSSALCTDAGADTDAVDVFASTNNTGNNFRFVTEGNQDFWQFNLDTKKITLGCHRFDIRHDGEYVTTFVLNVTR